MHNRFFLVLLLTLAALGTAACSGDDDDNDDADDDAVDDDATNDDVDDDFDDDSDDDDADDDSADDDSADDDGADDDTVGPQAFELVHEFPPVAPPNETYEHQFKAQGGVPPYHDWTLERGELPAGTTLNADTGLLSGTPTGDEKLYYFVLSAQDSSREAQTAYQIFGIRVGDPGKEGLLLRKARGYQEVYNLRHNSDGLSVTADQPDDPYGDYWFSDLGDACFIHGNSSVGAAMWYAVEGGADALANAQRHARGLDLLTRVTGIDGLLARSYQPKDAPVHPGEYQPLWPESENHEGTGEYADYYWKGDVSIDQYSGELVGLMMMYDLVDDEEIRAKVRQVIVDIADYLWDGGLIIYDVDGEPTTYGDFRGYSLEGWPVPNGLNSAADLAWFTLAYHASGEQRFADYRQQLLDRGYANNVSHFLWVYLGYQTKHYNVYMGFENMYALTRLEQDAAQKEVWIDAFTRQLWQSGNSLAWRRSDVAADPTHTMWYLGSTEQWDPFALYDAIWQLDVFVEAPLRDHYMQNSLNPDIEKNPERPDQALYPLPANLHVPDMCMWHRSPYQLDGGEENGRERTGHDYLLPYWMARYYGIVGEDW